MASLTLKLLSSLAAVCATAGGTSASPEAYARELLRIARSEAAQLTACGPSAEDAAVEAAVRILQRHADVLQAPEGRKRSYVKASVRNALRDEQRKRSRTRDFSDLTEDDGPLLQVEAPASFFEAPSGVEVEEFRDGLSDLDQQVLRHLEQGDRERGIAELTGHTRHEVRRSLARIRRSAERYFSPA
ncbi:MAG: hypothetical protein AAF682_21380 [Planctomycetota bacterium]